MGCPKAWPNGAAFFRASANSLILAALWDAVQDKVSLTRDIPSTPMQKPLDTPVIMSAASASPTKFACANLSVGINAAVACSAVRPLRVRFSNESAASVDEYAVSAPTLNASLRIISNSFLVS